MNEFKRYAIYHAPAEPGLAEAGAQWLGWDAERGCETARPALEGLPRPLSEITAVPRKYGFHATIKAPFRLFEERSLAELEEALEALSDDLAPVRLEAMEVATLGDFLALRPVGDLAALRAMAGSVVERLDPLRAPLSEAEIAKRKPESLSLRQRDLLTHFGYPYVFEQFEMHMTLSGPLPAEERARLAPIAEAFFAPHLPRPYVIGDLCLFGEAADGRFHLIHRYALTG